MSKATRFAAIAAAALVCVSASQAVEIQTVSVSNPGNPADPRYPDPPVASFGGVDNVYNIGTFEVTAGQYRDFLNAVDPAGSNPYGIYNSAMDIIECGCQITWSGSTYDFSGRPSGTEADWVDRPVNYVSWGDAARFANWLHNGQPTGQLTGDPAQDAGLTEDGSYYLNGATSDAELMAVVREEDATWVIPSEDEWYKAAYYDDGGSVYYDYPMSTDAVPNNGNPEGDTGNSANFDDGDDTIGSPYWRTEVGFFSLSASPYDTFDQAGNVWEWNETAIGDTRRGLRGGSFSSYLGVSALHADYRSYNGLPSREGDYLGFRVAEVFEQASVPAVSEWGMVTMALLVLTAGTLVWARRVPAML